MTAAVVAALAAVQFTYRDEIDLHEGISAALTLVGIEHERERPLGSAGRIDLLTADGVGIEVKVAGSLIAVTRQMLRYAHHGDVRSLVLVSTIASHQAIPAQLAGVPVAFYSLIGQGL